MGEDAGGTRTCQWCGASAPLDARTCPGCEASLGEREALGDVRIPGVTAVDPALEAYDAQPWRIPKASPTQGMAGGTIAAAAAMGGPAGLAALAGLGAVAATEYLAAGRSDGRGAPRLEDLGRPPEFALRMLERLEGEGASDEAGAADAAGDAKPRSEPSVDE